LAPPDLPPEPSKALLEAVRLCELAHEHKDLIAAPDASARLAEAGVAKRDAGKLIAWHQRLSAWSNLEERQRQKDLFFLVRQTFPLAFSDPPKPLKIGIRQDLAREVGEADAMLILRRWCRRGKYREVVAAGGPRIDLNGNQADEVSDEQREFAREKCGLVQS